MIYGFAHVFESNNQWLADILKYGQGADYEWQSGTWGSRIYRQAGNIPGWGSHALQGPNGAEMRTVVSDYQQQTGRTVHKDKISIVVWDFTNYVFPDENFYKKFLAKIENYLIENYQNKNGKLPVGNIKTESHAKDFYYVDNKTLNNLFIFEDQS